MRAQVLSFLKKTLKNFEQLKYLEMQNSSLFEIFITNKK